MINQILEYIRAVIVATYSTKTILPNSHELTDNTDVYLKNGYGVIAGDASVDSLGGKVSTKVVRNMSMSLTKRIYDTDLQSASRISVESTLFTESLALIEAISTDKTVKEAITNIDFLGDNGIRLLEIEKIKYLTITVDFEMKYNEFY